MALLPLEPFIFPDDLLTAEDPREDGSCWWVLHTRPRAEKALARKIGARNLSYFLPLHKKQWRSRGRLLSSYLPLFTSYVFLRGDGEARRYALETNLVANCLPVPDQRELLANLTSVHRLMTSGAALTPEDRLRPGMRVEIIDGPMAGLEGTVLRAGSRLRFYVEVKFLQCGVSVEVEGWMIRPLSSTAQTAAAR
jgi:transcriptional antiterminator RfaH